MTTRFTIIIPSTNSPILEDVLAALQEQTYKLTDGEVLVIGPRLHELQNTHHPIHFVPANHEYSHASDKRNLGIKISRSEILLFLDDDCIPAPDWLRTHLDCHASGESVVGGSVTFPRQNYIQLADNISAFHFMTENTTPGNRNYLCTANLSINRSVIDACGDMQAKQNRAEDLEWTARIHRLGYNLYFEPNAKVVHNPNRRSITSFWEHWWDDAPHTLRIRLQNSDVLDTPKIANWRWLYLWCSPFIAAWATLNTFSNPRNFTRYGHTFPLVYLSKLIWCWSAYKQFPSTLI